MVALQQAASDIAIHVDPTFVKVSKLHDIQIGFEGSVGQNSVSPRGLLSSLLNNLVEVEGIVTKCSNVRPKVVHSVHYCEETKTYLDRDYRDNTSLDIRLNVDGYIRNVTSSVIPTKDNDGKPIDLEYGLSKFKDYQTLI